MVGKEDLGFLPSLASPPPPTKEFIVRSNYYWVEHTSTKGNTAEVSVECEDEGRIDSALRYTPPPKARFEGQIFIIHHLVLGPTPMRWYGPDGKTLIQEKMTGPEEWRIEGPPGPPWTTVNTAIRYVLEMRDKATDPILKKNADKTLAILLQHH